MNDRRPVRIVLGLVAVALVSLVGSGLLDVQGKWGEPRQAAANILWMVFLLSLIGLVITGARMLVHRRSAVPR